MRFDCLIGQHTCKEQKIELLKGTDLVSFFDESTLSNLVDRCRKISLETSKVLFNQDYLENTMYLILKKGSTIYVRLFRFNLSRRHYNRLKAGVFGCARKRDDITDIFHTCDELN